MTNPANDICRSIDLAAAGLNATEVARLVGVPRSTVRDWIAGHVPRTRDGADPGCPECGNPAHDLHALPPVYCYLLGIYLGDGCLSAHRRGVYKLRVSLDARYPGIVKECETAIAAVMPRNSIGRVDHGGWIEVFTYSKSWPCLFPQHGPGKKHEREIALTVWQRRLVEANPRLLLRGLIHSDGCRFQNSGRCGWSHPRYVFDNRADGIRRIFCEACELVGLHWTASGRYTIYVSRKADVARLDEFVGPKA